MPPLPETMPTEQNNDNLQNIREFSSQLMSLCIELQTEILHPAEQVTHKQSSDFYEVERLKFSQQRLLQATTALRQWLDNPTHNETEHNIQTYEENFIHASPTTHM